MPDPLVIDAGLALRALLPNPAQPQITALLDGWGRADRPLLAPSLWLYEVTSAIAKGVHLRVLSEPEAERALQLALEMEVQLVLPDAALAHAAYAWTRQLRRAAACDSFYLALAEVLACELWTVDQRLQAAAGAKWIRLPE